MSKVKIDTDKIDNTLLPIAKNDHSQIASARSFASKVSFPYGEFEWKNIYNQIDACVEKTNKYINWMDSVSKSAVSSITSSLEDITAIKVDPIVTNNITVK